MSVCAAVFIVTGVLVYALVPGASSLWRRPFVSSPFGDLQGLPPARGGADQGRGREPTAPLGELTLNFDDDGVILKKPTQQLDRKEDRERDEDSRSNGGRGEGHRAADPDADRSNGGCAPSVDSVWSEGTFCDEFLSKTALRKNVTVCRNGEGEREEQIRCSRSPHSRKIGRCVVHNVAIRPADLYERLALEERDRTMPGSHTVQLLESVSLPSSSSSTSPGPAARARAYSCANPDSSVLATFLEKGDPFRLMVSEATAMKPARKEICDRWVEDTTFMFMGSCCHIYFRFLAWYNLYQTIVEYQQQEEGTTDRGEMRIIRVNEIHNNYLFPEFEKDLFSDMQLVALEDFKDEVVCFKKMVFSPWSYASVLFDCKMNHGIVNKCFHCDGKGKCGTTFNAFRKVVLDTCGLSDADVLSDGYKNPRKIVIISRKRYKRHHKDDPSRVERILQNEPELVSALGTQFPEAEVVSIHAEDLSICEQIEYAHSADILVGVHGAGLVHAWWLREDRGLLFEIVPGFQVANPTFKMLTTLTGRNYHAYTMRGSYGQSRYSLELNVKDALASLSNAIENS